MCVGRGMLPKEYIACTKLVTVATSHTSCDRKWGCVCGGEGGAESD